MAMALTSDSARQFTIDDRPDELDRYYGNEIGYGFQVFLRIRPSRHGTMGK